MRRFLAVLLVVATTAKAEEVPPRPDVPEVNDPGLYERCYSDQARHGGYDYGWSPLWGSVHFSSGGSRGSSSSGSSSSTGSSSLSGIGGGKGGPEVALIVAVLLAAALPVIIYALDGRPDGQVLRRFYCPSVDFDVGGGVFGVTGPTPWSGLGTVRVRSGWGHLGVSGQGEIAPIGVGSFGIHFLVRPTPRQHLEGGFALGFKRSVLGTQIRDGFEIALPHEYVLAREGEKHLGIELRPGVQFSPSGIDLSVEGALNVPLSDLFSLRFGGKVGSFGSNTLVGFTGGVAFHL